MQFSPFSLIPNEVRQPLLSLSASSHYFEVSEKMNYGSPLIAMITGIQTASSFHYGSGSGGSISWILWAGKKKWNRQDRGGTNRDYFVWVVIVEYGRQSLFRSKLPVLPRTGKRSLSHIGLLRWSQAIGAI